jgi:short-subunit dehydrogenase
MQNTVAHPAVVTGATGGMGSATVRRFAAEGRPLILCDLHEVALESLGRELEATAGVELLPGDCSDPDYPQALVRLLGDRQVSALVHTAGLSPTMADGPRIVEVNFHATRRLIETLRTKMAAGSCAVLIASIAAHAKVSADFDEAVEDLLGGIDSAGVARFSARSFGAYGFSKRAVLRFAE